MQGVVSASPITGPTTRCCGRSQIDDIAAALDRSRAQLLASDVGLRASLTTASSDELASESLRLKRAGAAPTEAAVREIRRMRAALTQRERSSHRQDDARRDLRTMVERLEREIDGRSSNAVARVQVLEHEQYRRQRLEASGRRLLATPAMLEPIGPPPERPSELALWRRRAAVSERSPADARRHGR